MHYLPYFLLFIKGKVRVYCPNLLLSPFVKVYAIPCSTPFVKGESVAAGDERGIREIVLYESCG